VEVSFIATDVLKNCDLSCGDLYFLNEVVFVEEVEFTGSGDGFVVIEEMIDGELDGSFDEVVSEFYGVFIL